MFEKGDLVRHTQGSLWPQGEIRGVVIDVFGEKNNFYKVFWYTTASYQNVGEHNLRSVGGK